MVTIIYAVLCVRFQNFTSMVHVQPDLLQKVFDHYLQLEMFMGADILRLFHGEKMAAF